MQGLDPKVLSSIIGDIYDCALQPEGWVATLTRVNALMQTAYTTISLSDPQFAMPRMASHSAWDPVMLKVLNEEYGVDGVPGLREVVYGEVDTPRSTLNEMSEADFYASPFYRNWAEPQGLRDACVMKFVHTVDRVGVMASITYAQRDIISEQERSFMALLAPHFRRAAMIGDLLDHQRVQTEHFRHALEGLHAPVLLVDASCKILYANINAQNLLDSGQVVKSTEGYLSLTNPALKTALNDAVLRTTGESTDLGSRGIGIPVSQSGHTAAVAYVLPLKNSSVRSVFTPAVAALFFATAVQGPPPPHAVLATLYDLTPSEARVMALVGSGLTTLASAGQLHVTENTVKTHLARVYQKTGATRQSELVQIVSALAPPMDALAP
jgi:DNA-binding CsgD family transcriptional regulator